MFQPMSEVFFLLAKCSQYACNMFTFLPLLVRFARTMFLWFDLVQIKVLFSVLIGIKLLWFRSIIICFEHSRVRAAIIIPGFLLTYSAISVDGNAGRERPSCYDTAGVAQCNAKDTRRSARGMKIAAFLFICFY